jgi:hypothetical protein
MKIPAAFQLSISHVMINSNAKNKVIANVINLIINII